jgi:hypothetical protein
VRAAARTFSAPFDTNTFDPATVNYDFLMFAPTVYPTNWDWSDPWYYYLGWQPTTPTRYKGDVPLPPEWLQINGQTLINSGVTNSDGSVWGETLVFAPSGTTPDVTPSIIPGITLTNNDYTFEVQVTNLMKIVDANTG